MKRIFGSTLILFFVLSAGLAHAETIANAGFGYNGIILSDSKPVVDESIKVGMPLFNETDGILTGSVQFLDNDVLREVKKFSLMPGQFNGVTFVWKAAVGKNNLVLRLDNTALKLPKQTVQVVVLDNREMSLLVNVAGTGTPNTNGAISAGIPAQAGMTVSSSPNSDSSLFKSYTLGSENQESISSLDVPVTGIDAYRADFLGSVTNAITNVKKDITENLKQNELYRKKLSDLHNSTPRSGGGLLTPLQYLYVWFLGAAAFIMGNPILFYGLGILFAFLILRFIYKRTIGHHRRKLA